MSPLSSHIMTIEHGINFRDLGGIKTQDGRTIRSGLLFRSGDFSDITKDEIQILHKKLNLQNVLDYRDHAETQKRPDNLWPGVNYLHIPANPLSNEVTATLTNELRSDNHPKKFLPTEFMIQLYQLLPFNNLAYQKLIELLLRGESLVQHCAIGKDRTGIGVAITLFILGVDEQTIMTDYILTDKLLANYREKLLNQYKDQLGDNAFAERQDIFLAKPIYLQAAFDAIKQKYQSIDDWLKYEYQLNEQKKRVIQNYYLS
ncbi:protein tyrosine/serine phosphatase [Orbus hercynius]|uniref:Protein tyrosine/serine phosphatase n=1 Tax=Orbus hercynius TaxID=593135 RepID=A0A495RED8_9GAMM|nr:tyrosine-protein phosphatase [Orbus hercynius]RKS85857.1 protein tyrosine/serine phosphatase [Orbus hercynius]